MNANKDVENISKNNEVKKEKKHSKLTKKIMLFVEGIIIIILIIGFMKAHNENKLTITTKSSLEKIMEINKLSTIEYTYNAIVTKYKNDEVKEDNVEYYVAYNGKVTAGIDFNEINIDVDYKEKKIYVTLPNVEIHETNVDMGTLDYIHEKNVPEKDSISQEAYKLCKNDLRERAQNETELLSNAEENATRPVPEWLEKDNKTLSGKVVRLAAREDIDIPVAEHLIVELYSK